MQKQATPSLILASLGVVFGDIGTSPLYTLKACLSAYDLPVTPANILGILSLIFWALVLVVAVKYAWVVMRADNHGEGGIMALTALAARAASNSGRARWLLLTAGLLGASLFYGDGVITPAISVLSAMEGLEVAAPSFKPAVIPAALAVLAALFLLQRKGTETVGHLFGPVMLLWFFLLFASGAYWVAVHPGILLALSPITGFNFMTSHGFGAFVTLGAVVLAVTGAEALYADMGHFGLAPIRRAWFLVVLPALVVNYFGQGALLSVNPKAAGNPFFQLFPSWAGLPMVLISGVATVIASQAVISGAYSATRQALLLGYLPRLLIIHTSEKERGQIYLPGLNWLLLAAVIVVVLGFKSSGNLGAAYGIAVTGTMLCTTVLVFFVARHSWKWPLWKAGMFSSVFIVLDGALFGANLLKLSEGGWFPLGIGLIVFTLMSTWKRGRELLYRKLYPETLSVGDFLRSLPPGSPIRVPGTAIYMTLREKGIPHALLHNLKHNKVLHERVVLLTIKMEDIPRIAPDMRAEIRQYGQGFQRITARFGFMEQPDIPKLLDQCGILGFEWNPEDTTFFLSRQRAIPTREPGMALWRERLFAIMLRLSANATDFFRIPANQVLEMGSRVEI